MTMQFNPLANLPGEYELGKMIRAAVDHDHEKMRFYLTCSVGELAQRIAASRLPEAGKGEMKLCERCANDPGKGTNYARNRHTCVYCAELNRSGTPPGDAALVEELKEYADGNHMFEDGYHAKIADLLRRAAARLERGEG